MDASRMIVLCSTQPGFIRNLAGQLAGRSRLLECYSISEAEELVQQHQPAIVVADLRNASAQQLDRAFCMCRNSLNTTFVAATDSQALAGMKPPEDALSRVINVEVEPRTDNYANVLAAVDEIFADGSVDGPNANDHSDTGDADPQSSVDPTAVTLVERYRTRTPALRRMLERLDVAARHDVTLLLIGETGSGKTHLAQLIHESSQRRGEPLVTVACGALPRDLIESELFGHVKGAFTSAHADKDGKFVAAGRGTILLDEIDALSPEQQVKLLRVIEKGLFEPVGSNNTVKVEARIIAASNLELQPLVEQGRFRPDLYYRLNTLAFSIPPLRQRLPDVEPMVRHFVEQHAVSHNIDVLNISDDFVDRLVSYPWPGNVREMENAIRSAVIYCRDGELTVDTLPPNIISGAAGPSNDPSVAAFARGSSTESLGNRIELTEKEIIEQALLSNGFSRTRTARQLGISRVTLYNKMRKYDLMPRNV